MGYTLYFPINPTEKTCILGLARSDPQAEVDPYIGMATDDVPTTEPQNCGLHPMLTDTAVTVQHFRLITVTDDTLHSLLRTETTSG
jgi:hypothetical protein